MNNLMTVPKMRDCEWTVSWSGGKDSTATIILMRELGIPVKKIIYIRMMYDETTPATLPVMTDFVDKTAGIFRRWGYNVDIVPSIKTAKQLAEARFFKSAHTERNGKPYGIAAFGRGFCKFTGVKQKTIEKSLANADDWQMIGYSADETARLHRLGGKKQSIMVSRGICSEGAIELCRKHGLLSPLYDLGVKRDGCFFCPNAGKMEREMIKALHPELVFEIYRMIEDTTISVPSHWIHDYRVNDLFLQ